MGMSDELPEEYRCGLSKDTLVACAVCESEDELWNMEMPIFDDAEVDDSGAIVFRQMFFVCSTSCLEETHSRLSAGQ